MIGTKIADLMGKLLPGKDAITKLRRNMALAGDFGEYSIGTSIDNMRPGMGTKGSMSVTLSSGSVGSNHRSQGLTQLSTGYHGSFVNVSSTAAYSLDDQNNRFSDIPQGPPQPVFSLDEIHAAEEEITAEEITAVSNK